MSLLSKWFRIRGQKESDRTIFPAGDCALVVQFGNEIQEELNGKVQLLNEILMTEHMAGIVETVPTFRSLMVVYDPSVIIYEKLKEKLEKIPVTLTSHTAQGNIVEIPVCYGGKYGEDLKDVAAHAGLTEEEVIRIHSAGTYHIYMLGFLPGFPYLGGLDERIHVPRLDSPRTRIPAGSVGIGGSQTGIYPLDSPGGWRLIGRTPLRLYDPEREEPFLYKAGDSIRFVPVTEEEYEAML